MTTALTVFKSTRPPFLILAPICIGLGLAISHFLEVPIDGGRVALIMLAAMCAHISVNTFNEYFDYRSGLDSITVKTPFSGGSGALVTQPKALSLVLLVAIASLLVASATGLYFVINQSLYLLPLGLVGVVIIVSYTPYINRMPWVCLITPGFAFGTLFVLGTYLCLAPKDAVNLTNVGTVALVSLVPFCLVNNLLLLNQLPDVDADRRVDRRTLPIVYNKETALTTYGLLLLATAAAIIINIVVLDLPLLSLLALLPLTLGVNAYVGIRKTLFEIDRMVPYLGKNVVCVLMTVLVYACTIGFAG